MSRHHHDRSDNRRHSLNAPSTADSSWSVNRKLISHAPISSRDFTESTPYMRKKYGVFGDGGEEEDLIMLRSSLRTPMDIKTKIMEAEESRIAAGKVSEKGKKNKKNKAKTVSQGTSLDGLINAPDILILPVDIAEGLTPSSQSARIKSGKEIKEINSRKSTGSSTPSSSSSVQIIPEEIEELASPNTLKLLSRRSFLENKTEIHKELLTKSPDTEISKIVNKENYFGLNAKRKFNALFMRAKLDTSLYATIDDIPECRRTPRTLYLRAVAASHLNPLPLILRKDCTPFDVSLAHR